jgi:hypothetical protein
VLLVVIDVTRTEREWRARASVSSRAQQAAEQQAAVARLEEHYRAELARVSARSEHA